MAESQMEVGKGEAQRDFVADSEAGSVHGRRSRADKGVPRETLGTREGKSHAQARRTRRGEARESGFLVAFATVQPHFHSSPTKITLKKSVILSEGEPTSSVFQEDSLSRSRRIR